MFTKALFLVVLGCAIAFASPAGDLDESLSLRAKRSPAGEKVAEFLHNIETKLKNWANKVKNTFENIWDRITGKDKTKAKQQQLKELQDLYNELQKQSAEAVEAKKAEWNKLLAQEEERVKKLREEADKEVEGEILVWDEKFDQLKSNAEKLINSLS